MDHDHGQSSAETRTGMLLNFRYSAHSPMLRSHRTAERKFGHRAVGSGRGTSHSNFQRAAWERDLRRELFLLEQPSTPTPQEFPAKGSFSKGSSGEHSPVKAAPVEASPETQDMLPIEDRAWIYIPYADEVSKEYLPVAERRCRHDAHFVRTGRVATRL